MADRAALITTVIKQIAADAGTDLTATTLERIETMLRDEIADIERQVHDDLRLRDD